MRLVLKLTIYSTTATMAAIGVMVFPDPACCMLFGAAFIGMRGMWTS